MIGWEYLPTGSPRKESKRLRCSFVRWLRCDPSRALSTLKMFLKGSYHPVVNSLANLLNDSVLMALNEREVLLGRKLVKLFFFSTHTTASLENTISGHFQQCTKKRAPNYVPLEQRPVKITAFTGKLPRIPKREAADIVAQKKTPSRTCA